MNALLPLNHIEIKKFCMLTKLGIGCQNNNNNNNRAHKGLLGLSGVRMEKVWLSGAQ